MRVVALNKSQEQMVMESATSGLPLSVKQEIMTEYASGTPYLTLLAKIGRLVPTPTED